MSDTRQSAPLYVTQTYTVGASKHDDEHYEIHARETFKELSVEAVKPCREGKCACSKFWAADLDVYYEAIGYEGQRRRCVFTLTPGTRGNGSAIDIATAITRDSSLPAEAQQVGA